MKGLCSRESDEVIPSLPCAHTNEKSKHYINIFTPLESNVAMLSSKHLKYLTRAWLLVL